MCLYILVITVYFSNLSSMPTTCQNIQFLGPFRYSRPIEGLQDTAYFFYYYHFPCHKIKNYLDITLKDKFPISLEIIICSLIVSIYLSLICLGMLTCFQLRSFLSFPYHIQISLTCSYCSSFIFLYFYRMASDHLIDSRCLDKSKHSL